MAADEMSDQAYAEFVAARFEEAAKAPSPFIFTNRGTTHARAVLEQIVTRAKKTLDIFSGCLSSEAYDPSTLRAALSRNVAIRVIIGDPLPFSGSSVLQHLRTEVSAGSILVRDAKRVRDAIPGIQINHFAIADGNNIRIEQNASDRSATVVLNAPALSGTTIVESYSKFFETFWERSPVWVMPNSF